MRVALCCGVNSSDLARNLVASNPRADVLARCRHRSSLAPRTDYLSVSSFATAPLLQVKVHQSGIVMIAALATLRSQCETPRPAHPPLTSDRVSDSLTAQNLL